MELSTKPMTRYKGGRTRVFRLSLCSCYKIFESVSEVLSILKFRLLFKLQQPSLQPKFSNIWTEAIDNYIGGSAPSGGRQEISRVASPYMLYNMESFWMGMCPFQTLHKC